MLIVRVPYYHTKSQLVRYNAQLLLDLRILYSPEDIALKGTCLTCYKGRLWISYLAVLTEPNW